MPLYADHIWKWPGSGGEMDLCCFVQTVIKKKSDMGHILAKKLKKKKSDIQHFYVGLITGINDDYCSFTE